MLIWFCENGLKRDLKNVGDVMIKRLRNDLKV